MRQQKKIPARKGGKQKKANPVPTSSQPSSKPINIDQSVSDTAPITVMQPDQTEETPPTEVITPETASLATEEPTPEVTTERKSSLVFVLGAGLTLGILVTSLTAYWYWRSQPPLQVQVIELVSVEPSVAPKASFDPSVWVLEVLNGSGVAGRAGSASKLFTTAGFTVVKTGNAATQTYSETEVYVKETLTDQAELLLEQVRLDFMNATYSGTFEPAKDSTATARIIIGK